MANKFTDLEPYFTHEELMCPTLGIVVLQTRFADRLRFLRIKYGKPMVVTSCCRSDSHNKWLQERGYAASPNSFHLIDNPKYFTNTCAIDIKRPDGDDLANLIKIALNEGWSVGIANSFIHLDRRSDYTSLPRIVYNYK